MRFYRRQAYVYFALALGWSWVCWWAAALWGRGAAVTLLYLAGGLGPPGAALLLLRRESPVERREFLARLIDPRLIPPEGWVAALLVLPGASAAAALIDRILGGSGAALDSLAQRGLAGALIGAVGLLLIGPLPEEIGWRGYALDRLLRGEMRLVPASLVIALIWAFWHFPLYWVPGTYQYGLGAFSESFWQMMLALPGWSLLMTAVYWRSRRSTLTAVLIHFVGNLTGELISLSSRGEWLAVGLGLAAGTALLFFWSRRVADRPNPA